MTDKTSKQIWIKYPYRNTKQMDVRIGTLLLHFSYETVVAFDSPHSGFVISENIWSVTTGRHLNEIHNNKDLRIPNFEFKEELTKTLKHYGLYIK